MNGLNEKHGRLICNIARDESRNAEPIRRNNTQNVEEINTMREDN